MFSNVFVPKNPQNYECVKCDYITCNKKDYAKHLQTQKHKNHDLAMFSNETVPKNPQTEKFECENCKKKYLDN